MKGFRIVGTITIHGIYPTGAFDRAQGYIRESVGDRSSRLLRPRRATITVGYFG